MSGDTGRPFGTLVLHVCGHGSKPAGVKSAKSKQIRFPLQAELQKSDEDVLADDAGHSWSGFVLSNLL